MRSRTLFTLLLVSAVVLETARAGVLPEDRTDALYHSYDGGGVTINGPSVLFRKEFLKDFSFSANYYVDMVSSASIDVITTASPYEEQRNEYSVGVDYLHNNSIFSIGYTNSNENDYKANTAFLNISQDVFGGMTTITIGYARGSDEVRRNGDSLFSETVDRRNYRLGVSQVLSKNMLVGAALEVITDQGFLNNPYRSVRYFDSGSALGYSFEPEVYPATRTSTAVSVRSRYFLPFRAALSGGYRYFSDTWEIEAHTADIGYIHPIGRWTYEISFRYYAQTAAEFYSDLFPNQQYQNFLARDKELSTFDSQTIHAGVSYDFMRDGWRFFERGTMSFYFDYIQFQYDDFRDLTMAGPIGQEPLYEFNAQVMQFFVSFWY